MTSEIMTEVEQIELEEDMPTIEHHMICSRLHYHLSSYVYTKKLGEVFDSGADLKLVGKRPNRYPDVSFVRRERLPTNLRSYADFAPDLAAEVASPNDKIYEIEAKVKQYQKSDVKLVWVVYPYSRTIDVYHLANGLKPRSLDVTEELDGEDVLPGFKLAVSTIFDYPPPPDEFDETNSEE